MNKCTLAHILTGVKIFLAMRAAVKSRSCEYVRNRKGKAFLAVRYLTGEKAWQLLGKSSGFWFLDAKGRDVSELVLECLQVGV